MVKRSSLLLLLVFASVGCGPPLAPNGEEALLASADAYLRAQHFNGTVLIARHGEILLARGYGAADVVTGRPTAVDTIYPIGSLTKAFTALAILQLHERGMLDVHDPVANYVVFPDGEHITIHHLLSHTSGMPRDLSDYAVVADDVDVDAALAAYPGASPAFEVGTGFFYSNLGYEWLTLIVERVSGERYEDYLQREIFEPLGMARSGVAVEPLVDSRAATGYRGAAASGDAVPALHARWWKGAGGIYSTVEDLYRWELALTGGELLGADAWREMHAAQSLTSDLSSQSYGYGWRVIEPQQVVWHSGDLPGYHAGMFRDIKQELAIVTLSNDDSWAARGVDLISLYQRGRDIEQSRIYPLVPLAIGNVATAGSVGAISVLIVGLRRRGWRLARPGIARFAARFVVPLALAVVALLIALAPVRDAGAWDVLTVIAPAIAWLSTALFLLALFLTMIATSAFVRVAGSPDLRREAGPADE